MTIASMVAGCGAEEAKTTIPVGELNRPAPGMVEMYDLSSDLSSSDQEAVRTRSMLDVERVVILKEDAGLKFKMTVASPLPEQAQPGAAMEWGFLLDLDRDGTPDKGVFADLSADTGWLPGIYDPKTKARQTGAAFSGEFNHSGDTLTWTVKPEVLGAGENFSWFAFADAGLVQESGEVARAVDIAGNPVSAEQSADWPLFP